MTIFPSRAAPLAAALALLGPVLPVLAQGPNTPAVSREFTVFFGDARAEAVTVPFTYSDIPLPTHAESRQFTYFAGELHLDAWSREVSLEVLSCDKPVPPPPALVQQPGSVVICPLPPLPVGFSVDAQSPEPIVYLWQRFDPEYADGWLPIVDGFAPGIGVFSGAQTATLSVSGPVQPVLTVRVVASNSCASAMSEAVTLRLCAAEFNCDGAVNSGDITAFLTDWIASIQQGTLVGDFNGDGQVNSADITAFLTGWLAAVQNGC